MADRKMSATELASQMDVNRVTVSGWASSDTIPSFRDVSKTLEELCLHLKCKVTDLIVEMHETDF